MKMKNKIFETVYLSPDLLICQYLNSYFIKINYNLKDELYRTNEVEICYYVGNENVNINSKEIISNLKNGLFKNQNNVKFTFHIYKPKYYLIVPHKSFEELS